MTEDRPTSDTDRATPSRRRGRFGAPPTQVRKIDETSVRGGVIGIAAVAVATAAISIVGALITLIVALIY